MPLGGEHRPGAVVDVDAALGEDGGRVTALVGGGEVGEVGWGAGRVEHGAAQGAFVHGAEVEREVDVVEAVDPRHHNGTAAWWLVGGEEGGGAVRLEVGCAPGDKS